MWLANSKAVIFHIEGGLGNQLFQYAAALGVSRRLRLPLILDARFYGSGRNRQLLVERFNIDGQILRGSYASATQLNSIETALGLKLFALRNGQVREKSNRFDERLQTLQSQAYCYGYWQNERYFADVEKELREQLIFTTPPNVANLRVLKQIQQRPSVAVHVRRGDYLSLPENRAIFVELSPDYYTRAAQHISESAGLNLQYFVFSDDPQWAAENIKLPGPRVIVDINSGAAARDDLRLMAACNHAIIANSSFSWWGAWLNANANKIIVAPKKWYRPKKMSNENIISKSFVVIENEG